MSPQAHKTLAQYFRELCWLHLDMETLKADQAQQLCFERVESLDLGNVTEQDQITVRCDARVSTLIMKREPEKRERRSIARQTKTPGSPLFVFCGCNATSF